MRKLRVALVILLLLTFIAASQVVSAKATISPKSMGDALSIGKSRALLQNIEKKLVSSSSDIGKMNQELSDYTKYMAKQNIANVTKAPGANKTKSTVKPPSMKGYDVPMGGIGDAIKALGNIHMKIKAPIAIAKSIVTPRLAVIK
jgi:Tfp pilus assembly protein PilX